MPHLRANGLDVHFTREGAGPPLILLHGATSSALADWSSQRRSFREAFTLYLVDARGHAGTRWDPRDGWSRELLVDDLLAFADAVGLATFHVAGFSMGGGTALGFAVRHPERLRTAIMVGTDVQKEPRTSVAARLLDPERIEREDPLWARTLERRHDPVQGPGAWKRLLRAVVDDIRLQDPIPPELLRRARLPILLACGDRDVFVPAEHAVALRHQLPDARLLVVPGSGHVVMVDQPSVLERAVESFWRATEQVARERAASRGLPTSRSVAAEPAPGVSPADPPDPRPRPADQPDPAILTTMEDAL